MDRVCCIMNGVIYSTCLCSSRPKCAIIQLQKKMRKDIVIFDCPRCDAVILEKLTQFAKNEQHM